jgi:N utilization substance protein B
MPLPIQKFREMVFQMLYSCESSGSERGDTIEMLMSELKVTKKVAGEAYARVQTILEKKTEIDEKISSASTEYKFDRISQVEKNLLRLGVYELFYDQSIPPKVVIAEAIRLCRKFGTFESAGFVNALLDALCPSKRASSITDTTVTSV